MKRKRWNPADPEIVEAMVRRVRTMPREEILERLAWRPEGAEETWMLSRNGAAAGGVPGDAPPERAQPEASPEAVTGPKR